MAVTLTTLMQSVFSRLHEPMNSYVATLPTQGSSIDTESSAVVIRGFLNEAQNDLARDVTPITMNAFWTFPAQDFQIRLANVTDTLGRRMHAARDVIFGGVRLVESGWEQLQYQIPPYTYLNADFTTPTAWFNQGPSIIGINQFQHAGTIIDISGYGLPVPLANNTDTVDTIPDYLALSAMPLYACWKVAEMNEDDTRLAPYAAQFLADYTRLKVIEAVNLVNVDPDTARGYFPAAVAMAASAGK